MTTPEHDSVSIKNDFIEAFVILYAPCGMKGISVNTLCARAGYSRSTFYRTFYSLDNVLEELEDTALPTDAMDTLLENANDIGMETFSKVFLSSLTWRKDFYRVLFLHDKESRFFNKCRKLMFPVFKSQVQRVLDMTEFEYNVLTEYLTTAKVTLLRMWAVHPSELSLAHITKITDSTLEGALWDKVEEAYRAKQNGAPHKRTTLDELSAKRPWIAYRYDANE
ncbi:MAG: TetR/AcrR family transcriptional regulator [Eggerthellaceae bacterium]